MKTFIKLMLIAGALLVATASAAQDTPQDDSEALTRRNGGPDLGTSGTSVAIG